MQPCLIIIPSPLFVLTLACEIRNPGHATSVPEEFALFNQEWLHFTVSELGLQMQGRLSTPTGAALCRELVYVSPLVLEVEGLKSKVAFLSPCS